MAQGGVSFWKVFLGVLAALALAGACGLGACLFMLGGAARGVRQVQDEQAAYRSNVAVSVVLDRRQEPFKTCQVKGVVANRGNRTITLWRAKVRFHDEKGATINTESASGIDTIGPSESKTFTLPLLDCDRVSTVSAEIEQVWLAPD